MLDATFFYHSHCLIIDVTLGDVENGSFTQIKVTGHGLHKEGKL